MSKEVDDAVKFSIEDIKESLDTLDDEDYVTALWEIAAWCSTRIAVKRAEEIRNAGGRAG